VPREVNTQSVSPLASNIAAARGCKGLTQEAFARAMDASLRTVQNWEYGTTEPKYDTVTRIAAVSDMTTAWFYVDHDKAAA
jgi:DNA-binding transcriptional regulator YiaG